MSSEAPKSEQIQANVAAALSRLRGDLSTSSVSSAVVSMGIPDPAPAADSVPEDSTPAGIPDMPGLRDDSTALQADPAMATYPSSERNMREAETDRPTPLQRIAGLKMSQPDLLSNMSDAPPPLADLSESAAMDAIVQRRRRNRLVLAGGVALVVLVGAVWILMSGGGEDAGSPPVITADATPEKVKPEDEGGMQVPNLNTTILDQTQTQQGGETVMPPPETPITPPAPAAAPEASQTTDAAPAVPAPAAPDVPSVSAPDASAQTAEPPAPAQPAPEPTVADVPAVPPAPAAEPAPAAAPAPVATTQATAPEPAATQTASAPVSVPAGSVRIQIAAVKSEAAAQELWAQLQKRHPAILGGLGLSVEKVDKGSAGVLYRVQAGPFADKAAAKQACVKLKSQNQDCIVAR